MQGVIAHSGGGGCHDLTFKSSLLQKIELRSFVPRDYSRQRTGKMAESRMGDEEACLDL